MIASLRNRRPLRFSTEDSPSRLRIRPHGGTKGWRILFFLTSLVFLPASTLSAESLRGPFAGNIELTQDQEGFSASVGFQMEDIVFISLPDKTDYLEGIELEIRLPHSARHYREALSLNIYKGVAPQPSAGRKNYSARSIHMAFLPESSRFFIQIPLAYNHQFSASGDTEILNEPVLPAHFPMALTLLPLMKGIPDEALSVELQLKARPLLRDEGKLSLSIEHPTIPEEDLQVTLDGVRQERTGGEFVLSSGIHELLIEAPGGHRQAKEFVVLQGKTTEVTIPLADSAPQVTIEIPQDAEVILDGELLEAASGKPFALEAGKHTVVFQMGEYHLTKEFTLHRGETAKISLNMEILLEK